MKALIAWLRQQRCPYDDMRGILREGSLLEGHNDLLDRPNLSQKTKKAIVQFDRQAVQKELTRLCQVNRTRLLLWGSEEYPQSLYEIEEPPPILYIRGQGAFPPNPGIAIIGSRHTTPYGVRTAKRIARSLASEGIAVISGFAEGIDTVAHRAALESGQTIAVLGCGIDWIYPKSNATLYGDVANSGILITEFPFGEKPYGYHFPFRNRVISGLSDGILLIEGTHKSGAMSTVRHGLNQGKTIYALPGDIDRKMSEGPNQLIFDGAEPLLDEVQIIDRFRNRTTEKSFDFPDGLTQQEILVLRVLDREPCSIERIRNLSNLSIHDIVSVLTALELNSLVVRQGNLYYRSRR